MITKKMRHGLYSILLTFAIIVMLVISGPVQAVTMSITSDKTTYSKNNKVIFTMEVNVENAERVPVQYLILRVRNSDEEAKTCKFDIHGNPISGCSNIEITPLALGQRGDLGFGYNLGTGFGTNGSGFGTSTTNFGYGYGFDEGKFKYQIKWNLKDEKWLDAPSTYHASLEAFAQLGSNHYNYITPTKADFKVTNDNDNDNDGNGNDNDNDNDNDNRNQTNDDNDNDHKNNKDNDHRNNNNNNGNNQNNGNRDNDKKKGP